MLSVPGLDSTVDPRNTNLHCNCNCNCNIIIFRRSVEPSVTNGFVVEPAPGIPLTYLQACDEILGSVGNGYEPTTEATNNIYNGFAVTPPLPPATADKPPVSSASENRNKKPKKPKSTE